MRLLRVIYIAGLIAKHGRDAFYGGDVADDIIQHLQSLGGLHTHADFANAAGNYVEPISSEFRGHQVYECPPNGQGVIALLLLNILKEFEIADDALAVDRMHLEIEACRLAYRVRAQHVADPDQVSVPVKEMLSRDFAAE